jgi:type 1 fimbria pilin
VGGNPVSADPVQLGEWDSADFTGPGYTTPAVPFSITLSNCETDTSGAVVATANIVLDGVKGSTPVGPPTSGVFSLTSDSAAEGVGIQVLKADGVTAMPLQTEVPMMAITSGNIVLNFNARFYQTGASSAIRPGIAKGALSFTITYK